MEFQLGASVKPRKITEWKKNLPSREIESCNDYECMLISLAHKRIFLFDEQFMCSAHDRHEKKIYYRIFLLEH